MASNWSRRFTQSSNPMLSERALQQRASAHAIDAPGITMTRSGAINKTFFLLAILVLTAIVGYSFPSPILIWGGAIAGLIIVIIAARKPHLSPTLAPIYAALEGLFVGGISFMYASVMNGIILNAVTLTMLVFFVMLVIHKTGIIPVTNKFRTGVMMATGAVLLIYVLSFVLRIFGINMPFLHEGGPLGILISLAIIGIAALNLLLDFDFFEKGEAQGAPAYMEWFAGMGLIITLVWIYVEVLRLLAILRE